MSMSRCNVHTYVYYYNVYNDEWIGIQYHLYDHNELVKDLLSCIWYQVGYILLIYILNFAGSQKDILLILNYLKV